MTEDAKERLKWHFLPVNVIAAPYKTTLITLAKGKHQQRTIKIYNKICNILGFSQ